MNTRRLPHTAASSRAWEPRRPAGVFGSITRRRDASAPRWAMALLFTHALSLCAAEIDPSKLPPAATRQIDFIRDVKPILQNHCLKCHSDEKPKAHFRLTSREFALKGGEHGVDIIPGQSAKSPLIAYVARLDEEMAMPPEGRGEPLNAGEIGVLRAWIDQGVKWEATLREPATQLSIVPIAGGTAVRGDAKKFRELYWQRDGWDGGLDQFELTEKPAPDSTITASGHVLLDDYKINLSAEKTDLGFARFGWSQFRRYYDDTGGYYPLFSPSTFSLDRDLHMDIGRAWTEVGLTLPHWPKIVVGYDYQYRDGTESTLHWGPVSAGATTRDIYPAFETVSEKTHTFKVDLEYDVAGVTLSDNFRAEWYRLATYSVNESGYTLGASGMSLTTADDRQKYFQGANTFHLEKQLTGWWLASGGFLYSHLSSDGAMDVVTLNPTFLNPIPGAPGWDSQSIQLERESSVFSLSSLLGSWEGLTISLGAQSEWTRQQGFTMAAVTNVLPFASFMIAPETLNANLDRSIFTQDLGLRFTRIPFTTIFADVRFQQDDLGEYDAEQGGLTEFLRRTDMQSDLKDFRVGFNTSPWRRLSLSGDFRRYENTTDYDTLFKEPSTLQGYPAFIRWRDLLSQEAQTKLSFQVSAWLKTSFTYQWLKNHYRTATDPVDGPGPNAPGGISPGESLLAGTYDSQIASLNATLTPWRRLFFSTTFSFQHARTQTDANGAPAIAPYVGNIYSILLNGTYALNDGTDLIAGYSFSTADFSQDNFAQGLPLGAHYHQHAVQAGCQRKLGKNKNIGLQYRYYSYSDAGLGGANDFAAHALFATFAWRLP
ncbi:MAG TPA: c-type cytochrome domain-containing protein [Verrucomicrobiae bacterium]|nr:c-type cytochrome domain-containing protein [Verrucomicrobiae bacterium]